MIGANEMGSKYTFRPVSEDGRAYQRQLRDQYEDEPAPPVPHLRLKRSRVKPISRRLASDIILRYEWLGTMSKTSHHYGLFFGPYVAGATCVAGSGGSLAGSHTHKQFGIDRMELSVLSRGACAHWAPTGANSRLVSWTVRLFAEEAPGARILMAFADLDAGEIGTIYQACNWVYLGPGKSHLDPVDPSGRAYNRKLIGELCRRNRVSFKAQTEALAAAGWDFQRSSAKHRYCVVLRGKKDPDLLARVEEMRLPYPKRSDFWDVRAAEASRDAAGHQPEEGGSTPTLPLPGRDPDEK